MLRVTAGVSPWSGPAARNLAVLSQRGHGGHSKGDRVCLQSCGMWCAVEGMRV